MKCAVGTPLQGLGVILGIDNQIFNTLKRKEFILSF